MKTLSIDGNKAKLAIWVRLKSWSYCLLFIRVVRKNMENYRVSPLDGDIAQPEPRRQTQKNGFNFLSGGPVPVPNENTPYTVRP